MIVSVCSLRAQQLAIDSLNRELHASKSDTTKLRILLKLCDLCEVKDNLRYAIPAAELSDKLLVQTKDSSQRYELFHQKASAYQCMAFYYQDNVGRDPRKLLDCHDTRLQIYKQIGDKEGLKTTLTDIADFYWRQGDIFKQLETLKYGLLLSEQMNYLNGQARFVNQIKDLYLRQGDTVQAISYHERAVQIEKKMGDTTRIGRGNFLSGLFYSHMGKFDQAINFYKEAARIYNSKKDTAAFIETYLNIAEAYKKKGDMVTSEKYLKEGLDLAERTNDIESTFYGHITWGHILRSQGKMNEAILVHEKALRLVEPFGIDGGIGHICSELAYDYFQKEDYPQAKKFAVRSLALLRKSGTVTDILHGEELNYKIDSAIGNFSEAFSHYQQFILLRDKLNDEEVHQAAAREKFQSDYDAKRAADKAEQEKKDALSEEEKQRQRLIIYSVSAGFALVLLLAIFILKGYRQKQKDNLIISAQKAEVERSKHIVEEKQQEILDSISYAQRIQNAILPPIEEVYSALPQSFILFKPKDIVAGDFFWFETRSNKILIAAADCTGHGVPGAFMSTIGSEKLNEAVKESTDVSEILNLVNRGMKKVLRQSEKADSTRDGMDIALCAFNKEMTKVDYAGANRPLWIIRKGNSEIEETKATKVAIGGYTEDEQIFTKHTIDLQTGDSIYIFSDGYADQFSPQDKKLMTRKFKEILLSIQDKTMEEQKQFLGTFIEDWRGDMEQTDDILVIGIRV
ncbi:MAG: protein serine/threonine phosphatase [Bacteroidetes bacterium]|nr:protein serine/threonine phosphatase [Bacteroidota bacterium]